MDTHLREYEGIEEQEAQTCFVAYAFPSWSLGTRLFLVGREIKQLLGGVATSLTLIIDTINPKSKLLL